MAPTTAGLSIACWRPVRNELSKVLRQMILTGELAPGERLIERDLANKLGVSRTPIRESVSRLESEGLVEHLPRKGCVVRKVSAAEVVEIFLIRSSLEALAGRLAAERGTPQDIARLKKALAQLEAAMARGDSTRTHDCHVAFHEVVYKMAQSQRLSGMLRTLVQQSFWFARVAYGIPGRIEAAKAEHVAMARAIEKGDGDLAEMLSREHVIRSKEAYLQVQVRTPGS
ncbi:MAG: GntR family transcriptional regulator [Ignavibacteriales bacterium]